jgi:hypothetical protein
MLPGAWECSGAPKCLEQSPLLGTLGKSHERGALDPLEVLEALWTV